MSDEEVSLPTSMQLLIAPEMATLAELHVSLELAVRMLRCAHPSLDDDSPGATSEPMSAQLALAWSIQILAASLKETVVGYQLLVERIAEEAIQGDSR